MATAWIMVRLPRELHERLRRKGLQLLKGAEFRATQLDTGDRDLLTLHGVIAELLRRDDEHGERSRKARRRRRRSSPEPEVPSQHTADTDGGRCASS
jgi:hypothetical protein